VAGLAATLGNGAMSNSIPEIEDTQCVFVFGYNAADSHPIVARRIINAKQKGAKIIVTDPRMTETARIADVWLQIKNGTNMALVNAFANVLIEEGLYNKEWRITLKDSTSIERSCRNLRRNMRKRSPAFPQRQFDRRCGCMPRRQARSSFMGWALLTMVRRSMSSRDCPDLLC
jgi:predicted molibdopterin-dependent oxidoreductase YjgC